MKIWAVVPARSGSKRFKNKNIHYFKGKPLLAHSIEFAKKLSYVDKVLLSTDSKAYADIGIQYGAIIPFLRSTMSSSDDSMEEDVLEDIRLKMINNKINFPDAILWLRPTHPIRSIKHFELMYKKFLSNKYSSVVSVTSTDYRTFIAQDDLLFHISDQKYFQKKSMYRSQDVQKAYRMFHGELFYFSKKFNKNFLGEKIGFVEMPRNYSIDIDYKSDING